jgi:hypothetical protein
MCDMRWGIDPSHTALTHLPEKFIYALAQNG